MFIEKLEFRLIFFLNVLWDDFAESHFRRPRYSSFKLRVPKMGLLVFLLGGIWWGVTVYEGLQNTSMRGSIYHNQ